MPNPARPLSRPHALGHLPRQRRGKRRAGLELGHGLLVELVHEPGLLRVGRSERFPCATAQLFDVADVGLALGALRRAEDAVEGRLRPLDQRQDPRIFSAGTEEGFTEDPPAQLGILRLEFLLSSELPGRQLKLKPVLVTTPSRGSLP
jgi:hypothetical protein